MARSENLKRLLKPRHVALIGGDALAWPLEACRIAGYEGEIWVVNPNRAELGGHTCFASLADLPEAPDASFVAVRREASIEVVRELAAMGAGGCVCYAAGFSEIGGDGAALQDELAAAAGDLALVGPNCFGVLNYIDGVALWADQHGGRPVERGVAIVSQSGNISLNLTMAERSVPLAYVISVGNQAVLGIEDFVDALADDPRITAIGLYVEGLRDVAGFSRAAARALVRGLPIVALKVGTSDLGAQVALSHTSSLAGSDRLYQALFERLGVVRVDSIPALLETLKLLSVTGPIPGPRLRVLTCSGGESALTADLAETAGLTFPAFTPEEVEDLRSLLPVFATVANPLDYNTAIWGDAPALERCCTTAMEGACDAAMLVIDCPDPAKSDISEWDTSVDAFVAGHKATGRPAVVASTLSELLPASVRERLAAAGVAPMQGLSRRSPRWAPRCPTAACARRCWPTARPTPWSCRRRPRRTTKPPYWTNGPASGGWRISAWRSPTADWSAPPRRPRRRPKSASRWSSRRSVPTWPTRPRPARSRSTSPAKPRSRRRS